MRKTALLLAALLVCAGSAEAKPAVFFRKAEKARPYTGSQVLGSVSSWRDQACKSTFTLTHAGEPAPVAWTIDWKKVINARISSRTSFAEDVLASVYEKHRGVVVAGRAAFSRKLPDGTVTTIDNFEFFLTDQTRVEALVADLQKTHQDCG